MERVLDAGRAMKWGRRIGNWRRISAGPSHCPILARWLEAHGARAVGLPTHASLPNTYDNEIVEV
jgi:hypothetical protein